MGAVGFEGTQNDAVYAEKLQSPPAGAAKASVALCPPVVADADSHCTPDTKTDHGTAPDRDFVEALALIARIPLTDTEKAEGVRRLLASKASNP